MKLNGTPHPLASDIVELDVPETLVSPPFDEASLDEPVWLAKDASGKRIGNIRGADWVEACANVRSLYGECAVTIERVR